ncbi:MAG: hypothetical protein ACRDFS_00320 [Chloroflexota bacterium]
MGRESRQQRRAKARRQAQQPEKRGRNWTVIGGGVVIALVIIAVIGFAGLNGGSSATAKATATAAAENTPVAGIAYGQVKCSYNEMISAGFYHEHAHLSIYDAGKQEVVPADIGFKYQDDCLTWMHTHSPSEGIIHMEAPYKIVPTLGEFFQIWGTPLTSKQIGSWKVRPSQKVKIWLNLKPYSGNPKDITLHRHTQVTIEIGPPYVKPTQFPFAKYGV